MKKIVHYLVQLVTKKLNEQQKFRILKFIFYHLDISPTLFAYKTIGVLNYQNSFLSGEVHLHNNILPQLLSFNDPIIFDVGANVGNYTEELYSKFPNATIYSFEPAKDAFLILSKRFKKIRNIRLANIGFGDENEIKQLFTYKNQSSSEHASIYKEVITETHQSKNVDCVNVNLQTLDTYCAENNIDRINFLKIDTEGYEFKTLIGAKELLKHDRIDIIQFEFNEMNVIARVFFKDFYDVLSEKYHIYRLNTDNLILIDYYDSSLEIFKFQNFIAVHRNKGLIF
jgi:FkbM family methyltransferase